MSRISKADIQRAYEQGKTEGYRQGFTTGRQEGLTSVAVREAQVKLMNAVGQTLHTQGALIDGLARVLDCGPRG